MTITLNSDYDVALSTALLGYVGETNARPVSVEGMEIDGADRYVLTIDYGDGVTYEVDITGGTWTPTADILRSAQTVSCQIAAKKLSGDEYVLVKKSRIFRLRIGAAIDDNAIPSPSVAADALDRISAIGEQVEADVARAENAASTAMQAAENAEKSATTAGVSADTATQAASRAETAKTAAETSAAQAETARQGAENARQQAVTSQNNAKISAAQAATSAQQTTADKNITAGYAKTAKTCADSTAADRQAVADSLPDDYTTAVGKIAENTAEIGRVKLSDKELQRRVNALYDMENGITHQFETDTDTAYAKTVPTGAKLMSVKNIGGRSIVWNQLISQIVEKTSNGIATTKIDSKSLHISGTSSAVCFIPISPVQTGISNHKYLFHSHASDTTALSSGTGFYNDNGGNRWHEYGKGIIFTMDGNGTIAIAFRVNSNITVDFSITPQIFDLTAMFGSGNEPTSVEEFEKMFPADYYPYNAGEIICAGVESVAVGETAHLIPEAIKALPGYGWSAGTAKNYVDYENKKYVQCVGSVDLGTVQWVAGDGERVSFQTSQVKGQKLTKNYTILPNFLCSKYLTKTQNEVWGKTDVTGISADANADGYVYINDMSYTDVDAFKQAMSGVILYYELAEPIVTDISSLIPDDFLRNIEVEAGGSITFKGGNDNYRIPVPSEEEYVVKLSEVGGTA